MSETDKAIDTPDLPPAIPAATIVVFRRNPAGGAAQLLLVERAKGLAFAGGATVFPGGKVDPGDHALGAEVLPHLDPEDAASRIAAVREALEETGLVVGLRGAVDADTAASARRMLIGEGNLAPVLARFGWTIDPEALVPFARWLPRHAGIRNFDTRFYLADLGTGAVDLVADATESRHLFWASAAETLALADRGHIRIIFPTRRNLERLARFDDFAAARAHTLSLQQHTITPREEVHDGQRWLTIPDGLGYPVLREPLDAAMRD